MVDNTENQLLQYLPEVFREDQATRDFLLAFERILLGRSQSRVATTDAIPPGLEQIVNNLSYYFTPTGVDEKQAPDDFLPWLSQWVALSLRTDVTKVSHKDNALRREFIANVAQGYADRGTKKNMEFLLEKLTGKAVIIEDEIDDAPHYFKVMIDLDSVKNSDKIEDFERAKEIAHSIIRLEKPAHTRYWLIPMVTTMRIGQRAAPPSPPDSVTLPTRYYIRVGRNTRLGAARWSKNS